MQCGLTARTRGSAGGARVIGNIILQLFGMQWWDAVSPWPLALCRGRVETALMM